MTTQSGVKTLSDTSGGEWHWIFWALSHWVSNRGWHMTLWVRCWQLSSDNSTQCHHFWQLSLIKSQGRITKASISTMAYMLLTSSHGNPHPTNGRPPCIPPVCSRQDLTVQLQVDFKGGRTAGETLKELQNKPSRRQDFYQKKIVIVALGGNDLSPGKKPSTDKELGTRVANTLKQIYDLLRKEAKVERVIICTLMPRPAYNQKHQDLIEHTNQKLAEHFPLEMAQDLFNLHSYFKKFKKNWSDVFWTDGIHLNVRGVRLFTGRIARRAWIVVKDKKE